MSDDDVTGGVRRGRGFGLAELLEPKRPAWITFQLDEAEPRQLVSVQTRHIVALVPGNRKEGTQYMGPPAALVMVKTVCGRTFEAWVGPYVEDRPLHEHLQMFWGELGTYG